MSLEPDTSSKKTEDIRTSLFDKIFRDRNGEIVLAQAPNLPLICWLIVTLLKLVFPTMGMQLDAIAFALLFTWAWEEIFQGVNYFRRALGVIVLTVAIAGYVSRF